MAGHCSRIDVSFFPTAATSSRRGRVQSESTQVRPHRCRGCAHRLHAGGKFGGDGYKVSGGLHGVGISVVNALGTGRGRDRPDGKRHAMSFGDGELKDRLAVAGGMTDTDGTSRTGTTVRFWPDGSIFAETDYRFQAWNVFGMAFYAVLRSVFAINGPMQLSNRRPRWVVQLKYDGI